LLTGQDERPAAFLDRDGVINQDSDSFIKTPDEWRPIPGSLEAIARLNHAGYHVILATNQSGVGRGLFEVSTLNAIHDKMHRALAQIGGRIAGAMAPAKGASRTAGWSWATDTEPA